MMLLRRLSRRPNLRNEQGVAMMMALITFTVLSVLIGELAYETGIYNGMVFRQVDQTRARLLARSGVRLGLLQLRAAEKARTKAKAMGLSDTAVIDQIWQTPLILPPPAPKGLNGPDTESLEKFGKALGLDGTVSISITGENTRLSLNQMIFGKTDPAAGTGTASTSTSTSTDISTIGAPVTQPTVPDAGKQQALDATRKAFVQIADQILTEKRNTDDAFRDKYGTVTGQVLIGNILAWIDPATKVDGDNQQKEDYYKGVQPNPYALKNAPIVSESELYMIKGFDGTLANLFADSFTTQATSGFNVNDASVGMLRALLPELGEVEAEKLVQRRGDETQGGKFKSADEFWTFLGSLGNFDDAKKRLTEQGITILDKETSYRVIVSAKSGQATKTWVAQIGPKPAASTAALNPNAGGFTALAPVPADPTTGTPTTNTSTQNNDSNSLSLIYLKGD